MAEDMIAAQAAEQEADLVALMDCWIAWTKLHNV